MKFTLSEEQQNEMQQIWNNNKLNFFLDNEPVITFTGTFNPEATFEEQLYNFIQSEEKQKTITINDDSIEEIILTKHPEYIDVEVILK